MRASEIKDTKKNLSKISTTRKYVLEGVFPTDPREPKGVYTFWLSHFLERSYVCVGDLVNVSTARGKQVLYVTDIREWKEGEFEPQKVARSFYGGEKYQDFEYELNIDL